jgi:hypothetical protein
VTATARPTPGEGARPAGDPAELGAAARAALDYLVDLTRPPAAVRDGRVDHMLRAALTVHDSTVAIPGQRRSMDEAAAAVRTACAHLAAAELEDAYLALRAAVDRLPRGAPDA